MTFSCQQVINKQIINKLVGLCLKLLSLISDIYLVALQLKA